MRLSSTKYLLRKLHLSLLSNTPLSDELTKLNNAMSYLQNIISQCTIKHSDIGSIFYLYKDIPYFEFDTNMYLWYRKEEIFEKMCMLGYSIDGESEEINDIVEAAFNECNPNIKMRITLCTHIFPL